MSKRGADMRCQRHSKSARDPQQGGQSRIAVFAESLVKSFTRHPSLARDLGHAAGPGDDPERLCDVAGVATHESVIQEFRL